MIAVLAGVALLAASACGESSSRGEPESDLERPTTATAGGSPGTPLGDGFTVIEGTQLIGDPIPAPPTEFTDDAYVYGDDGWTATMAVTGADPLNLLAAYARQAADAGMTPSSDPRCLDDRGVWTCTVNALSPGEENPRTVTITSMRGTQGDLSVDHLVLRYSTLLRNWHHISGNRDAPPPGGVSLEVPAPPVMAELPDVGEAVGTAPEIDAELRVQPGSRLAGPVGLNDNASGIHAIFEVTGDPQAVLDAYIDHLTAQTVESSGQDVRTTGDGTFTVAELGSLGGDSFVLTLIERPDRPTWLSIRGSHG